MKINNILNIPNISLIHSPKHDYYNFCFQPYARNCRSKGIPNFQGGTDKISNFRPVPEVSHVQEQMRCVPGPPHQYSPPGQLWGIRYHGRRTFRNLRTISGFHGGLSPKFCIASMGHLRIQGGARTPPGFGAYVRY